MYSQCDGGELGRSEVEDSVAQELGLQGGMGEAQKKASGVVDHREEVLGSLALARSAGGHDLVPISYASSILN